MATVDRSPLRTEGEFQHALSEVERLLDEPHAPETVEDRWFARLLGQIAEYHDALTPEHRDANLDRLRDLDRQLKAFGKRWPRPDGAQGEHPWEPLLGGDIDPSHHHG